MKCREKRFICLIYEFITYHMKYDTYTQWTCEYFLVVLAFSSHSRRREKWTNRCCCGFDVIEIFEEFPNTNALLSSLVSGKFQTIIHHHPGPDNSSLQLAGNGNLNLNSSDFFNFFIFFRNCSHLNQFQSIFGYEEEINKV